MDQWLSKYKDAPIAQIQIARLKRDKSAERINT
jgi:hypothetical protein